MANGSGTKDDPWVLKTPPGTSEYQMWRDDAGDPPAIICQVGGTQLKYAARSDAPLPTGTPVYVVDALSDTAVQVVSTAPDPIPEILPEPGGNHP